MHGRPPWSWWTGQRAVLEVVVVAFVCFVTVVAVCFVVVVAVCFVVVCSEVVVEAAAVA